MVKKIISSICLTLIVLALPANAKDGALPAVAKDKAALKALSPQEINALLNNPVSNVWRVIIQNNYSLVNGEISTKNRGLWLTTVRMGLPIPLTKKFDFVIRPALPILSVPVPQLDGTFNRKGGLGDIELRTFLSTGRQRGFIYGLGPAFRFPSSTDPELGTGKWTVGPNAGAIYVSKKFVAGAILGQEWSYAGKSSRQDVSIAFIQYFAWYIHPSRMQFGLGSPTIIANWKANEGDRWTVPVGLAIGRLLKIPKMPLQVNLEVSYAVIHPETLGQRWNFQLELQRAFPALINKPIF